MYHHRATVKSLGILLLAGAVLALAGCATEAIKVSDGALVDKVDYQWISSDRSRARALFYPSDEKVTLSVRFDYNLRAAYEWYRVEWIDPHGKPYKVVSTRTEFGSHRDLQAHIKIRGKMAARLPGLWRVRLYHLNEDGSTDRLLFARLFRIAAATPVSAQATVPAQAAPQLPASPAQPAEAEKPVKSTRLSTPLAAETGVSEATLTVEHSTGVNPVPPPPASRHYPGCPPLYYPPGPGCVEEAAEE